MKQRSPEKNVKDVLVKVHIEMAQTITLTVPYNWIIIYQGYTIGRYCVVSEVQLWVCKAYNGLSVSEKLNWWHLTDILTSPWTQGQGQDQRRCPWDSLGGSWTGLEVSKTAYRYNATLVSLKYCYILELLITESLYWQKYNILYHIKAVRNASGQTS